MWIEEPDGEALITREWLLSIGFYPDTEDCNPLYLDDRNGEKAMAIHLSASSAPWVATLNLDDDLDGDVWPVDLWCRDQVRRLCAAMYLALPDSAGVHP